MCELLKANELDGSKIKSSSGCSQHSDLAALGGAAIRYKAQFTFQSTTQSVSAMHAPCLGKILVWKYSPILWLNRKSPQLKWCHVNPFLV